MDRKTGPVTFVRRHLVSLCDKVLDSFQDVQGSLGWANALGGGMLPAAPTKGVTLTVKSGKIPAGLSGAYMRIGPNVQHWPPSKRTHVFDGDGMLHSVRISDGTVTYNCDYMQTPRFLYEKEYGKEWFTRIGEMWGKSGLFKILALSKKKASLAGLSDYENSLANTAIVFTPDGKLWALNEAGAPFRFRLDADGTPCSIGVDTLEDTLHEAMSAHPKFDQKTGECFFHGRKLMQNFFVGRIVNGKLEERAELKMPNGFHHDMFITENYVVTIDGSCRFDPKGVVKKKPLWNLDQTQKLRFGVYRRNSVKMTPEAFTWIEADIAAEIVHTLHAEDKDGKITLWTPLAYHKPDTDEQEGRILGDMGPNTMHRIVIDVASKSVNIEQVESGKEYGTEFPRIRDDRVGGRTRYGFSAIQEEGAEFNFRGFLKWDFEKAQLAKAIKLPEGVVGGEPVFMPKGKGDDEGYLGLILWNENTKESTFALYDAKTFADKPVVELSIPQRVPLGFHTAWIDEAQFNKQLGRD
eukprot:TRINITY_DN65242_c0_g1_i1.p1 TRINITY_DN65242_c0_g1~~TRINITY_DN65242_c0_g1_i1.p1  ORF type:complete len:522 (-),score=74.86 TRINITY_DN65242_c0_g1_i1:334-1899(-)